MNEDTLKAEQSTRRTRQKERAQLLPLREDDPGRIELRRQDLSGIIHGHPDESGESCGELGPELRAGILAADESDDERKADDDSEDEADDESHWWWLEW